MGLSWTPLLVVNWQERFRLVIRVSGKERVRVRFGSIRWMGHCSIQVPLAYR